MHVVEILMLAPFIQFKQPGTVEKGIQPIFGFLTL